jgi:hypothetical protein
MPFEMTPENYESKVSLFREKILWAGKTIGKDIDPDGLDLFINTMRWSSESENFYQEFSLLMDEIQILEDQQQSERILA